MLKQSISNLPPPKLLPLFRRALEDVTHNLLCIPPGFDKILSNSPRVHDGFNFIVGRGIEGAYGKLRSWQIANEVSSHRARHYLIDV
jgi:hypothetical protein